MNSIYDQLIEVTWSRTWSCCCYLPTEVRLHRTKNAVQHLRMHMDKKSGGEDCGEKPMGLRFRYAHWHRAEGHGCTCDIDSSPLYNVCIRNACGEQRKDLPALRSPIIAVPILPSTVNGRSVNSGGPIMSHSRSQRDRDTIRCQLSG